jgi:hypothetical protein
MNLIGTIEVASRRSLPKAGFGQAQVRHGVCIFGDFGPSWGCKQLFLQGAEPQNAM